VITEDEFKGLKILFNNLFDEKPENRMNAEDIYNSE